jgi:uncharacterized membrane protein YqjE
MANSASGPGSGPERPPRPRLLQSLKGYFGTWVEVLRVRLELLSTELEEERLRLLQVLVLGVAALFCLALGAMLLNFLVIALFWETTYRLVVVGSLALLYVLAGVFMGLAARRKLRQKTKIFATSLGELAKDYRRLSS